MCFSYHGINRVIASFGFSIPPTVCQQYPYNGACISVGGSEESESDDIALGSTRMVCGSSFQPPSSGSSSGIPSTTGNPTPTRTH